MAAEDVAVRGGTWPLSGGLDAHDAMALDRLRDAWGGVYDVGYASGTCWAAWLLGGDPLSASTPEGLESAIRADWARRSRR